MTSISGISINSPIFPDEDLDDISKKSNSESTGQYQTDTFSYFAYTKNNKMLNKWKRVYRNQIQVPEVCINIDMNFSQESPKVFNRRSVLVQQWRKIPSNTWR